LQDHDRALIMGETTFGKGLVQAQFQLQDGSALLLTIAHYYTPSGRLIQRDYSHTSMLEYYTARPKTDTPAPTDDVKVHRQRPQSIRRRRHHPRREVPGRCAPISSSAACCPPETNRCRTSSGTSRHLLRPQETTVASETWTPDTDTLNRFKEFCIPGRLLYRCGIHGQPDLDARPHPPRVPVPGVQQEGRQPGSPIRPTRKCWRRSKTCRKRNLCSRTRIALTPCGRRSKTMWDMLQLVL
jgi:hypothetical protein